MKLSEKLKSFRADRPDGFTMDSFIREAEHLENNQEGFKIGESWEIILFDIDSVLIKGNHNQSCMMHGGDFESVLSGLCAAYQHGMTG